MNNIAEIFFSNINHEIRTPLNAIMGFSELLKTTHTDKKDLFLDIIIDNGRQLLHCIDNLIYLSQLQAGIIKPQPKPVNLHQLLHKIFNKTVEYHKKLKDETIQLILKVPSGNNQITMNIDETMITCIFEQLLNNAVQYMSSGQIKIGYKISENQDITFFVQDTRAQYNSQHKEMFCNSLTKENSSQFQNEGIGMGLIISNYILEILNGTLRFETGRNKGLTFYFTVPCQQSKQPIDEIKKLSVDNELLHDMNVLVVEDDDSSTLYLQEILDEYNIKTCFASHASHAVNCIKHQKEINLVLMDIQLPDMNGIRAAEKIKKIRPEIPVIMQTGFSFYNDDNAPENKVWDDFILKPVSSGELLNKMMIQYTKTRIQDQVKI